MTPESQTGSHCVQGSKCVGGESQVEMQEWLSLNWMEIPSLLSTGCVSCLEHDEHYILTFPNGYGRQVEQLRSSDAQAVGPAIL